jgi:hypothetical protein
MTDEIELLKEARPPAAGPGSELSRQLREQLMTELRGSGRRWSTRRALPIAVPALAAAVAAIVVSMSVLGRGGDTAWAAALVRVAEAAPRLLVDGPGWQVTRADEFSVDYGEMTFSNGERELELHWQPAREYPQLIADRSGKVVVASSAPVAGAQARLLRYEGTNDFIALWVQGGYAIEARGIAPDVEAFKELLATMHEVDVDKWLSAMPESVVTGASRARAGAVLVEVARGMVADIPLPAGFDTGAIARGTALRDRYQLGAQVAGAVACAWIGQWVAARRSGDDAKAQEAAEAMATSRRWSVLLEMNDEGDYPEVLWEYADAIATNTPVKGGKPLSVEQSYENALGCQGS